MEDNDLALRIRDLDADGRKKLDYANSVKPIAIFLMCHLMKFVHEVDVSLFNFHNALNVVS